MKKPKPFPEIHPYVTAKGGVVILNGPFSLNEANRVSAVCGASVELLNALKGMFEMYDSYSAEFNPSGRARAVADWGLINERLVAARKAIFKAETV